MKLTGAYLYTSPITKTVTVTAQVQLPDGTKMELQNVLSEDHARLIHDRILEEAYAKLVKAGTKGDFAPEYLPALEDEKGPF